MVAVATRACVGLSGNVVPCDTTRSVTGQVDIGLCADLGTLQRLQKQVGSDSLVRELVFTARRCREPLRERAKGSLRPRRPMPRRERSKRRSILGHRSREVNPGSKGGGWGGRGYLQTNSLSIP